MRHWTWLQRLRHISFACVLVFGFASCSSSGSNDDFIWDRANWDSGIWG
ncbi:MAG: hypothetical protein AAGI27_02835 [Pseudomonadota bacterium]